MAATGKTWLKTPRNTHKMYEIKEGIKIKEKKKKVRQTCITTGVAFPRSRALRSDRDVALLLLNRLVTLFVPYKEHNLLLLHPNDVLLSWSGGIF